MNLGQQVGRLEVENERFRKALVAMIDMYVALVESGDAGFWDAEKVPEVIEARAALQGDQQ